MYGYRMAQPADMPWLSQAAVHSAWESIAPADRSGPNLQMAQMVAPHQLAGALSSPGSFAIIAQSGPAPVGYLLAAIGPDSTTLEPNGHLVSCWVAPAHRRRGIGRQMQTLAEGILQHMGIRKVKVIAEVHNQAALALAKKAGYEPEGLIGMETL